MREGVSLLGVGHQRIADRRGWKHICEIGPGKSREVADEEQQHTDTGQHPEMQNEGKQVMPIGSRHGSEVLHAAGQTNIAAGREDRDRGKHQYLRKVTPKTPRR